MRTPRPVAAGVGAGSNVDAAEEKDGPVDADASTGTAGAQASTVRSIASDEGASERTGSEGPSGGIRGEQLGETSGLRPQFRGRSIFDRARASQHDDAIRPA